ncbi:hypothetical protein F5887DRAFT_1279508 [Amanita rubescens]|nr:hypothetical protein F5887DRAFT_1279508 [Amanita rubescens]
MRVLFAAISAFFIAAVNAHFQLQFPPPRGPFVMNNEPGFCDGYTSATANRTLFPLSGGFFSLNSEHPQWVAGVLLATGLPADNFSEFNQIKPYFTQSGEGIYCFPLLFNSPNATNLTNGENVTIQIVFNGGDGTLFQCADLTLSDTVTLDATADKCGNATGTNGTVPTGTSANSTASSASSGTTPTSSHSSAERSAEFGLLAIALGLAGLATGISL